MIFFAIVSNMFFISFITSQNCPEKGISSHKILNGDGYRLTTLKRGNFSIQGLMTFTGKDCENVDADGLVRVYAMKYGIEQANYNGSMYPMVTIGYQLDNLCLDLIRTMARGIELVSLHRPNSVCRADSLQCDPKQHITFPINPPIGVVGTLRSSTSIPLAGLMALYQIPQISYSASSRILSKKGLYKSFFRTVPSDTNQIKVMLDIMAKFNWNYVFAIGSDDDYGKLGVAELKQQSHARKICVVHDMYIAQDSEYIDKQIDEIIEKIKNHNKAQVVVLFCYAKTIGDKILREANSKGIKRIWLTSESWNPYALTLDPSLKNQMVGILTVSLKTYTVPYLDNYIQNEIENNFNCDMWLQNYMKNALKCTPTHLSKDHLLLNGVGKGCPVKISDIMKKLSGTSGSIQNLVDAVTSLITAIKNRLAKVCAYATECHVDKISPEEITEEMYNVSFTNQQGHLISFDKYGNPKHAFYTVENIQVVNGSYKYIPVGNWSSAENNTHKLKLDIVDIQWPLWFTPSSKQHFPLSRCSRDCKPGWRVVGKQLCCWGCQKCVGNYSISNATNALSCTNCKSGYHTTDHIHCEITPIRWLSIYDPVGKSIVVISGIGFLITFITSCLLILFRNLLIMESSLNFVSFCSVLLHVTFAYGALHVIKPSEIICQAINSIFYLLLMFYTSIVMIKTKLFTNYLIDSIGKLACGRLITAQLLTIFALLCVEAVSLITWFNIDGRQMKEMKRTTGEIEINLRCQVSTSVGWYVSLFIPIVFLVYTSYCAFRERNDDHYFHEPKFLSFTCIALCMIIFAYIPTYYFVGQNKALTVAITIDLFAFTFIFCLIVPKVYVAVLVNKFGPDRFPLRSENALPQKSDMTSRLSLGNPEPVGSALKTPKINLPVIKEAVPQVEILPGTRISRECSETHQENEDKTCDNNIAKAVINSSDVDNDFVNDYEKGYVNVGADNELDNVD